MKNHFSDENKNKIITLVEKQEDFFLKARISSRIVTGDEVSEPSPDYFYRFFRVSEILETENYFWIEEVDYETEENNKCLILTIGKEAISNDYDRSHNYIVPLNYLIIPEHSELEIVLGNKLYFGKEDPYYPEEE